MHRSICLLLLLWLPAAVFAAPHIPASDDVLLERLSLRAADPKSSQLRELRRQLALQPGDAELAVRLARRYFDEVAAEGDPRYIGYAEAALAPWGNLPEPPAEVRVMVTVLPMQPINASESTYPGLMTTVSGDAPTVLLDTPLSNMAHLFVPETSAQCDASVSVVGSTAPPLAGPDANTAS